MAVCSNRPRVREADTFRIRNSSMSQKIGALAWAYVVRAPIERAEYTFVVKQLPVTNPLHDDDRDDDESDAAAIRAAMADPFRISLDEVLRLLGPKG